MRYIIFDDIYKSAHIFMADIENCENVDVIYKDQILKNKLCSKILSFYISKKLKKYVSVPFKTFIYKMIIKNKIKKYNQDNYCFVMISAWYDKNIICAINKFYPASKKVLVLRDTVSSNEMRDKNFKINQAKIDFDLILSYDSIHDVPKYSLVYSPVYMSKLPELMNIEKKCDVSLVMNAKDRFLTISEFASLFKHNNINYSFFITNVKPENRDENLNIEYSDTSIDRITCMTKELSGKCLLEILKGDAHSNTLRYIEAVMYNRKLITNWKGVLESEFYNPDYMIYYDDINNIDFDVIKTDENVDYKYNGEFSPVKLLELIYQNLYQ